MNANLVGLGLKSLNAKMPENPRRDAGAFNSVTTPAELLQAA